VHAQSLVWPWL